MKQRDSYDGSDAPFQGNVVLRLRSIPVNARILKAAATVTPVSDHGGTEPFTELIDVSGTTGSLGATKSNPGSWVEVDFHSRRTMAKVEGSNLANAGLQMEFGGGAYVAINQVGGFKAAPTDTDFPMPGANVDFLPALTVNKLKLTANPATATAPDLTTVTIRSVPSNVSLRVGDLAPFWTHVGDLPLPETTPDFGPLLQNFLATAKVENGSYVVPLTLHSDALARMRVDLNIEQITQVTALPGGLKEVVQPFDFSSQPQPHADVLQVEVPANSRVVPEFTTGKVKGGFEPTRVVLGPTGPVAVAALVEVSPTSTPAQPFTVADPTGITGIDLLITCSDPSVSLQADIRADLAGKPDNPPLFRGPVNLALEKKSAGENPAFWASVALPSEFHLEAKTYWLVLQCLNGKAAWNVAIPDASGGGQAVMQRSQDGGFSWRLATPQSQPSAGPPISGPLSALFRLRRKPDQFQVPIDLLVGSVPADPKNGPAQSRVKLDRFAALGRVDFVPDLEIAQAINQYLGDVAAKSPASCPEGEQLANGEFEFWSAVGNNVGNPTDIAFEAAAVLDGVSVAMAPNGQLAYVGVKSSPPGTDISAQIRVVDLLCDQPLATSEIDLPSGTDPYVVIASNGARLYCLDNENEIHVVDLTGEKPVEIGTAVDISSFVTAAPGCIMLSPDGNRIYIAGEANTSAASGSSAPTAEVLVFSTTSLEKVARGVLPAVEPPDTISIASGEPTALAISTDGTRLYVAISDATSGILVFDTSATHSASQVRIPVSCTPTALALTPDGSHAVVVGTGSITGSGLANIVDLTSQLSTEAVISGPASAVVFSADGKNAFVTVQATPNTVAVLNLNRASTVTTIDLSGFPKAVAINPQGDRVYIAQQNANSTPLAVLSLGSRIPADWMLTSGAVKPLCVTGNNQVGALLGEVLGTGAPPPDSGLSQVIPASSCSYDFSFWGIATEDGATGEVLWLGPTGTLIRADQVPIEVWKDPSAAARLSGNLESRFEMTLGGGQSPVLHRERLIAPDGVAQAEVRFIAPSGELVAIGTVSLAGAADAVGNTDLRILQNGIPAGWTLTPTGAGVSVSVAGGGIQIQNGGAATAHLAQTASLQAGQKFMLAFTGAGSRQPQSQQDPSIELHWLKADGTLSGPATVLTVQANDFDRAIAGDSVPAGTTLAEVHLVVPAGTSLTVRELSVQSVQTTTVPVSFVAQSPGELTVSNLRVGYEKVAAPKPAIPSGGLASPTPPGQQPGQPGGLCKCPGCGSDTPMVGGSPVKTLAGRPATVGDCIRCGTTFVRLGGPARAGVPQASLPLLRRLRADLATGSSTRRASPPKNPPLLTAIEGIGEKRAKQLKRFGIRSVRELAAARPQLVAKALIGVSLQNAPHFIAEARRLLETENR